MTKKTASQSHYDDPDELFRKHTIKEILDIQKKIRNDIERKKEDLRQLVGEKYHNLIEAADTIRDMRCTIEQVTKHIRLLEDSSKGINQICSSAPEPGKKLQHLVTHHQYYSLAAEIKILVDAPAKMWLCLEKMEFLSATKLYLIAQQVHAVLTLSHGSVLDKQFQFIEQQWEAVSRFHGEIFRQCQEAIRCKDTSFEKVAEALCCLMLLEGMTTYTVFQELLQTRYLTVHQIFKPATTSQQSRMSVKDQICQMVAMIRNTLHAVHAVIYNENVHSDQSYDKEAGKLGLLPVIIDQVRQNKMETPIDLAKSFPNYVYTYFPESVMKFRCEFKGSVDTISKGDIQLACQTWIEQVNSSIHAELNIILNYVNTIRGISQIRDAVVQLQEDHWVGVCECVLGKPLSVWDEFLRVIMLQRVKKIIDKSLADAFASFVNCIRQCLQDFDEIDVTSYTWTESAKDLSSYTAVASSLFQGRSNSKTLWDRGTLGMKARCLTPKIQALCKSFDQMLHLLLSDLNNYTCTKSSESDTSLLFVPTTKQGLESNDFSDIADIYKHLSIHTKQQIEEFCIFIKSLCKNNDGDGSKNETKESEDVRRKMVFLGRMCEAIVELCPHLYQCVTLASLATAANSQHQLHKIISFDATAIKMTKSNPDWESVKNGIHACAKEAFRLWFASVSSGVMKEFEASMLSLDSHAQMLKTMLQWDERSIQEEAEEEGRVITSIIRIPFQVSLPLYMLLHKLCYEINQATGHSLQPSLTNELVMSLFDSLAKCYSAVAESLKSSSSTAPSKLVQTAALQCLFDVHYLNGMFFVSTSIKEESGRSVQSEFERIISELELCIDPFDLDVFTPHLQSNLANSRHGTSLLFGLLMPGEWSTRYRAPYTSAGQDMHNLLPHTSMGTRFPLLPIPTGPSQKLSAVPASTSDFNLTRKEPRMSSMPSRSHSSSDLMSSATGSNPNLQSASPGHVNKSSSFYDRMTAMSSSWFGSS